MFHESNEMMKRVFQTNEVYLWGFLVVFLGGLLILLGQDIVRFYRKFTGRGKPPSRKSGGLPS